MHGLRALLTCASLLLASAGLVSAQTPPNSFPNAWPGQPTGPLSPEWQRYFEVTLPLPNLTDAAALPRSFAGNIPVDRVGHPNDTFFFWGFEKVDQPGSLTVASHPDNRDPWILWVQGGPGSSGMLGLAVENGPIHVLPNYTWTVNPYSWNQLADTIWIDQPVGTGFSTADSTGYVADEDQMAEDFINFLRNLVKVFPSLATRPLYLAGESYAGHYIPYLLKHILPLDDPPVNIVKVAIGNGFIGSYGTNREIPVITLLESFPELIGYDTDVFNYFKEQHHLCGFDINFTYPQTGGTFPPQLVLSGQIANQTSAAAKQALVSTSSRKEFISQYSAHMHSNPDDMKRADAFERREEARSQWKRDLTGRANGTIDPWYGCDVWQEMWDYAFNFTFPWKNGPLDTFDIPDALSPAVDLDPSVFLNDPRVRAALHAPLSKNWTQSFTYPFGNAYLTDTPNRHGDPSLEPAAFLSALFANTSAQRTRIPWVFYSGNADSQDAHRSTEAVLQNATFGGVQGFSRRPATPWYDDAGAPAGVVHQERGVAYVLFAGAGHLIPEYKPMQSLVFLREFILGDNPNGTVRADGSVVGGEDAALAQDYFFGGGEVFYGSSATQGTLVAPSATVASWESFLAAPTPTPTLVPAPPSEL